jgi:hypothetical protein
MRVELGWSFRMSVGTWSTSSGVRLADEQFVVDPVKDRSAEVTGVLIYFRRHCVNTIVRTRLIDGGDERWQSERFVASMIGFCH